VFEGMIKGESYLQMKQDGVVPGLQLDATNLCKMEHPHNFGYTVHSFVNKTFPSTVHKRRGTIKSPPQFLDLTSMDFFP
jgi:hypothetical protein